MKKINQLTRQATTPTNNVYPKWVVQDEPREKAAFEKDMILGGDIALKKLGKPDKFVIDEQNRDIIDQLWYFITNNPAFRGIHQKGIFLSGGIGTGKTVIMIGFLEVMKRQTLRNYTALFPETIYPELEANGLEYFKRKTLFIDDVCREPEKAKGYWGENPVRALTMIRNRYQCQSYATANFRIFNGETAIPDNQLITRYGAMIFDRMKEAYNFLELTGKSRR